MTASGSQLTLQVFRPIERLLLLKEEGVTDKRQSPNGLAVSSCAPTVSSPERGNFAIRKNQKLTDQAMDGLRCW